VLLAPLGSGGCAQLPQNGTLLALLDRGASATEPLNERTVASGLQDALRVAAERAVARTSRPGGFGSDPLLRIALPDELRRVASGLRAVGLGAAVDRLEDAMNRAAEQAAGEATTVLWSAVRALTIADAFVILNGGKHAGTHYFRGRTESELRARLAPIVARSMRSVGVYRIYDQLLESVRSIPLLSLPRSDLDSHITTRTLEGLFSALADEEEKIREDPAARTTALLRRVFGA
jgi:hypothetical protein